MKASFEYTGFRTLYQKSPQGRNIQVYQVQVCMRVFTPVRARRRQLTASLSRKSPKGAFNGPQTYPVQGIHYLRLEAGLGERKGVRVVVADEDFQPPSNPPTGMPRWLSTRSGRNAWLLAQSVLVDLCNKVEGGKELKPHPDLKSLRGEKRLVRAGRHFRHKPRDAHDRRRRLRLSGRMSSRHFTVTRMGNLELRGQLVAPKNGRYIQCW